MTGPRIGMRGGWIKGDRWMLDSERRELRANPTLCLTQQERAVARMRVEGCGTSFAEMSQRLGISKQCVKHALTSVFKKMNVTCSEQLAVVLHTPLDSPFRKLVEEMNDGRQ